MSDTPSFGQRLAALRAAAKLTQGELAQRSGLHLVTVARFETGTRQPSWDALCALAEALDVPLDAFRGAERKKEKS